MCQSHVEDEQGINTPSTRSQKINKLKKFRLEEGPLAIQLKEPMET